MLAHVDMDAFYASVEVLDRPELAGKPVIVGRGVRGVVSAASYEARALGVRSAMPIFQARRLCPRGAFLAPRMERYRQVSREVMAVLEGFTPVVEQVSVDEAFLDLSGVEGLWGPPRRIGQAIKRTMRENVGLTCSVGLAPVRFLAKIASERDKPDGLTVVEDVESFLSGVKLKEVSGVGARSQERLADMGLRRLTDVRALGPRRLESALGALGLRLWDLARGVDPTGVKPRRPVKSVSHEMTFAKDTGDPRLLESRLLALCQKACRRLRAKGLAGRVVTLKLRHADMSLASRRISLDQASDQAGEVFAAARGLLRAYTRPGPFRLIGVGVSGLHPAGAGQAGLFGRERVRRDRALSQAEDDICRRFGDNALSRAGALDPGDDRGHNQ